MNIVVKNRYIGILVAAIALAMVGLIAIQGYWINSAWDLRQDEFNRQVAEVMESVTEQLERADALEKIRANDAGNLLFRSIDTLVAHSTSGPDSMRPDYFFISDIQQRGDQMEIKVVEEKDGKRRTKVVRSDQFNTDSTGCLDIDWQESQLAPQAPNPPAPAAAQDADLEQRGMFVGEMVKSLIQVHIFEELEERLDSAALDSVLRTQLALKGIEADYVFGVVNDNNELVMCSNPEVEAELRNSRHKALLFPNDIAGASSELYLLFPKQRGYLLSTLSTMLAISGLLVLGIIYGFYFAVRTIIRQKKLSEIKNDFINNMTHELKTPISTISLACQALSDPDIGHSANLVSRYVGMIGDENKRLGSLVERVLQSAVLDKGDFKLNPESVEVNSMVRSLIDQSEMRIRERNGSIQLSLDESITTIQADREHITNVLLNLIDNGIKYSEGPPALTVSTKQVSGGVAISVADKGIGISREDQKRVFDKLYRVPQGNIHNVKGFGLGLNYVKVIVERHGGSVSVNSKQGAGSTFSITLPTHYEHNSA